MDFFPAQLSHSTATMTVTPEATETQSLLERQPTEHRESPRSWSTPKKAAILGVVSFAVFNE